ncbi:hypothetical protein [Paenibacillus sp. L3-i20]|uniref:hypothetical protein n=1 Tax=Paenibacillus sp. L3-i20 TaxID=2905833 RepID=UPI001EDDE838|nr:hypothetical protein [Paenibacillus sp. L3-i20]GKU77597.1 hypothetical protein L3i20_v219940 [Paenibacillus sp. L3-i20]
MNNEVILRSYSEYKKQIIWNGSDTRIVDVVVDIRPEQGIAGFTENKNMVGVFVRNNETFFLLDDKEYRIDQEKFICSNSYISNKTRQFKLANKNVVICDIIYEPYIDPGMLIYDADPEEFDILLYLSENILKSKETLENYLVAKSIK